MLSNLIQQLMGQQQQQTPQSSEADEYAPYMEKARRHVGLSGEDQQDAFRVYLSRMAAQLAAPISEDLYQPGFAGRLGVLNRGMQHGHEGYMKRKSQLEKQNAMVFHHAQQERQADLAREEQRQEREAMRRHRAAELAETKRYHSYKLGLMAPKDQQDLPEGAMLLTQLEPTARAHEEELILDEARKVPIFDQTIQNAEQLKQFSKEHPNLHSSRARSFTSPEENWRTPFWTTAGEFLGYGKEMEIIGIQNKLIADLNLKEITGISGKVMTDMMKRTIGRSQISGNLPPEAVNYIANKTIAIARRRKEDALKKAEALKRGLLLYAPPPNKQAELNQAELESVLEHAAQMAERAQAEQMAGRAQASSGEDLSQYSEEELMNMLRRK